MAAGSGEADSSVCLTKSARHILFRGLVRYLADFGIGVRVQNFPATLTVSLLHSPRNEPARRVRMCPRRTRVALRDDDVVANGHGGTTKQSHARQFALGSARHI